jgi:endonuclease-8
VTTSDWNCPKGQTAAVAFSPWSTFALSRQPRAASLTSRPPMPEGDTIHRSAQTLDRAIGRHVVTRFESVIPALTRTDHDAPIAGRTVERVWSQGKHLLVGFSGDLVLRTHMRMNGSWHVYRPGERWRLPRFQMRVVIETTAFVAVAFNVHDAEFLTTRQLAREPVLTQLGPDLLGAELDADAAVARLRDRGQLEIGETLLDQRALAGIGNVYKSEVCFVCRINPFTPVSALSDADLRRLVETARQLLQANVAPGSGSGIVTYHSLRRTTGRALAAERLWVYSRGGRPCRRCRTPIAWKKQGPNARSTYWCPMCQPD